MKSITTKFIITFVLGIFLGACQSQGNEQDLLVENTRRPSETLIEMQASSTTVPTNTKEPLSTTTPTKTTTPTPTITRTSTSAPSATVTPSATPTNSPTPGLVYNSPGFYPLGGCVNYILANKPLFNVDFCILSITINPDGHMIFTTSWTTHLPGNQSVRKKTDAGNRKMRVLDNLDNRYDHINVGGNAAKYVTMKDGDTVTGWFEFPPAQNNATAFTFYDNEQKVSIGPFSFTAPVILTEITDLTWYPLTVEYLTKLWEVGTTEDGGVLLMHTKIPRCEIHEWKTSDVIGKYKNTNELGGITYEIFGWLEDSVGMREYLAVEGIEGYVLETQPLFQASIPYDDSLQCIFDLSEVLATVKSTEIEK